MIYYLNTLKYNYMWFNENYKQINKTYWQYFLSMNNIKGQIKFSSVACT